MLALAKNKSWDELRQLGEKPDAEPALPQMRCRGMVTDFCRPGQMKSLTVDETRRRHRVVPIASRTHRRHPGAASRPPARHGAEARPGWAGGQILIQ